MREELHADIGTLNLRNEMNIETYINYPEETITEVTLTDREIIDLVTYEVEDVENVEVEDIDVENVDEDDSVERRRVTHKEALNCLETLSLYIVRQDIDDVVRLEHDRGLVRLSKVVRRLEDASRKQTSIRSFLQ